jgi:hypothetical protein
LSDFEAGDSTADQCDHSKLTAGCDDPRRHRSRRRLQFGARPTQYEDHALQRRYYHDGRDDNLRLARACAEYAIPFIDPAIVGRFVHQCHAVDRADKGMMGIVEVVAREMRRGLGISLR